MVFLLGKQGEVIDAGTGRGTRVACHSDEGDVLRVDLLLTCKWYTFLKLLK